MAYDLSSQTEQYLANIVAGGLFASKEAAVVRLYSSHHTSTTLPDCPESMASNPS